MEVEEMTAEIYHLKVNSPDADVVEASWDMTHRVREKDLPGQDEFERLYEKVGTDPGVGDDPREALHKVWMRWNAGSGEEYKSFTRRECEDCDKTFNAFDRDCKRRDWHVSRHEEQTDHTVALGMRSLMVGDIVVLDGDAYVCASFGWEELPDVSVNEVTA